MPAFLYQLLYTTQRTLNGVRMLTRHLGLRLHLYSLRTDDPTMSMTLLVTASTTSISKLQSKSSSTKYLWHHTRCRHVNGL